MAEKGQGARESGPGPVPSPGAAPSLALGMLLAAVSASSYGLAITLARLAFDGGANPGTVMMLRYLMAVAVVAAVLRALGWRFRPPDALRGGLARLADIRARAADRFEDRVLLLGLRHRVADEDAHRLGDVGEGVGCRHPLEIFELRPRDLERAFESLFRHGAHCSSPSLSSFGVMIIRQ